MKQLLTDSRKKFVTLAEGLVPKFRERAAGNDAENTFSFENFENHEDLRASGVLNLAIPSKAGLAATSRSISVQRVGAAEEVTAAVADLVGRNSGYITGTTLDINGGTFKR